MFLEIIKEALANERLRPHRDRGPEMSDMHN
jgi:hypothetical protein